MCHFEKGTMKRCRVAACTLRAVFLVAYIQECHPMGINMLMRNPTNPYADQLPTTQTLAILCSEILRDPSKCQSSVGPSVGLHALCR